LTFLRFQIRDLKIFSKLKLITIRVVLKKISTTQIFFVKTKIFWVLFSNLEKSFQHLQNNFNICKKIFNNCKIFSTTAKKY